MKVYLAESGGLLRAYIYNKDNENMNIYLAGTNSRPYVFEQSMKIYLAGDNGKKNYIEPTGIMKQRINILESFYYIKDWMLPYIKNYWDFLLDSGAFTFMQQKKKSVNWVEYTERYAEFIKDNDIKLFFEMDIDSIIGLKEVEKLRKLLEQKTGKQSIPVWHIKRGKQYFIDMCKDYPYVAFGAFITDGLNRAKYDMVRWFIDKAHENNSKIHGLGFTDIRKFDVLKFDSVDSTSWTAGNRFGGVHLFRNNTIEVIKRKPGQRMSNAKQLAIHNFGEWVKFQQYAERNL